MDHFNQIINVAAIGALEEAEILAQGRRRRHGVLVDPLDDLTGNEFVKIYRVTKPLFYEIVNLVEQNIEPTTTASGLSVSKKVLTTLSFLASGSYQHDIGKHLNHAISQASVSKAIREVTDALNRPEILNNYVYMPRNNEELRVVRNGFYQNHQFPGVIGCLDCTHVAIYPPKTNDPLYPEAVIVNRKGYHSINVQLICDWNLRIMNVSARFPGSTHDMYVWNNSSASRYMQNLHMNGNRSYFLLGDSGYALRRWLQTPIAHAEENSPEERYNQRLTSTRSLIEWCNGVLKLRFMCLLKHRVLHYTPDRCSQIINTCTILHNMCINNNLPHVNFGDEDEDRFMDIDHGQYNDVENFEREIGRVRRINPDLEDGRNMQQFLIRNNFNH